MSIASLMPAPNSAIKGVKKYLQQAVRLDKVEPLVAYYCRMYAMQQAIAVKNKNKEDMKVLGGLMTWLEQQKQLKAVPKEEAKTRCEAFALNVFTHADNEDRKAPGTAPEWKAVALSFHAAYVFMDVCKQFGALDKEFASRALYAKWKTADVFKALADNRLPKPGSFSEQNGGGAGGLEDELAALEREEAEAPAPAAASAAAKPKPAASPAAAAGAASPASANASANAQVPNFGAPAAAAPKPAPPAAAAARPTPAAAAPAAAAPSHASYPTFEAASYVPLDDPHHAPAPVVVVPHAYAPPAAAAANGGVSDADINAFMAPAAMPVARALPPAANPAAYAPAASAPAYGGGGGGGGGSGLNLPKGSLIIVPKATAEVSDAVHECEKLLRHAQSALNFEDADTAVGKLKDALALLLPYRKKL